MRRAPGAEYAFKHPLTQEVLGDAGARQNELRESQRLFVEIGAPIRAARVAEALTS